MDVLVSLLFHILKHRYSLFQIIILISYNQAVLTESSNISTIFVNSSGIDFDDCGAATSPCGTIAFASALSRYTERLNVSKFDLYISGQNEQEISLWETDTKLSSNVSFLDSLKNSVYYFGKTGDYSPCVLYARMQNSVEITFDPNEVKSMKDWFPDVCKQYWDYLYLFYRVHYIESVTIFNNLIINDLDMEQLSPLQILLSFRRDPVLILNNCSFYNITKTNWVTWSDYWTEIVNTAIDTSNVSIYNTSFHNIVMDPSDTADVGTNMLSPTFIEVGTGGFTAHPISMYMEYCTVTNYTNSMGPFMLINAENVYGDTRRVDIYNSIFSDIYTTTAIIVSGSFLNSWEITMNILSCNFLNINFGSILFTQNVHTVYIEDVFITTKQRVKDLTDYNVDHSLISLFAFGDDEVQMNNITLKYLYDITISCALESKKSTAGFSRSLYYCYVPIQFLQSEGIVNMTHFIVYNEIEYDEMHQLYSCSMLEICDFKYHDSDFDYALLSNDGILELNGFYIRGLGIAYQFLSNKGNAFIDNAIFQYSYYHDVFDPFTLKSPVLFKNVGRSVFGGVLEIYNSYLFGADYVAVQLLKGSAYIINTVFDQCQSALAAYPDVIYLSVDNVQFINIGRFYTSYVNSILNVLLPPPIAVSAQQSVIKNSYFSYFDRYGFILISPEVFEFLMDLPSLSEDSSYDTTLLNNTFELSAENALITLEEVQLIQSLYSSTIDSVLAGGLSVEDIEFVDFNTTAIFHFGCLICALEYTTIHMIGNTFYGNTFSDNTPFISIDNTPNTNCISNNIIYGYALRIISGTVTSCYRSELHDILQNTASNCWYGGLGQLDDEYLYASFINEPDYFIATQTDDVPLILIESAESIFAAEKTAFLIESNDVNKNMIRYYKAIKIISGRLFMFDVDFPEELDISYHDTCIVHCFALFEDSNTTLLQTNIECEDVISVDATSTQYDVLSLFSAATASFNSHFSAYSIELGAKGIYYPGGSLYLNHSIYDTYENEITDYDQSITLTLNASRIYLQMDIIIETNGDCVMCEQGFYIENISIQHVGYVLSITVSTPNNELTVNPVTFTVAECPAGFGKIATGNVCGLCDTDHFSFSSTSTECFSCSNVDSHSTSSGFNCNGNTSVIIDYNVWFSAVRDKEFISPLLITEDDTLYISQCPPQQCCRDISGCSFLDSPQHLCANNRDATVPLCGQCIDGTYELYGTASCGDCSTLSNLFYLIPICIATLLLVLLLLYDAKEVNPSDYINSEVDFKKLVRKDEIHCLSIMISKVLLYYYQSLSQILYAKGIENTFSPILNTFDLSFSLSASSSGGICIFPFISDPLIKIILNSIFILFGFAHFIWVPFVMRCFNKGKKTKHTGKSTFISVALLKLFVISCGTLLTVAFKLLSCITFPSHMAHFYNPNTQCFSGYWGLGLVLALFVVFAFILMAYKIYKQTVEQRNNHQNIFRKMIKSYKQSEWWWEFVIFSRRTTIALFTSIRNVNPHDLDAILLTLLLIYVVYHARKIPFKYSRLNVLETICLVILILIFAIISDDNIKEYTLFTEYFVALAILFPFIVMLYHIIKMVIFITRSSSSEEFSDIELFKIEKAKKRAPVAIQSSINLGDRVKTKSATPDDQGENDLKDEGAVVTAVAPVPVHDPTPKEIDQHHGFQGLIQTHKTEDTISASLLDASQTGESENEMDDDEVSIQVDKLVSLALQFDESIDVEVT